MEVGDEVYYTNTRRQTCKAKVWYPVWKSNIIKEHYEM